MISLFNVLMISLVSCEKVIIEAPNNQGSDDDEVAAYTFRLLAPSTTRATTATDFKVIYAFDIVNGSVSQSIEQKSTDSDFGTITLDLSRGSHTLRFFATDEENTTISGDIITQANIGDTFYKSISFDASQSLSTTEVVLQRLVAKITNETASPVTLTSLLNGYNITAQCPVGTSYSHTLANGESLFILPPSSGYITTDANKTIPVSSNHVTVIKESTTITDPTAGEVLIMTNDTAAFYLAKTEITGITLSTIFDPLTELSALCSPYRLPTRLEARAISTFIPADDYWTGERLICYDDPKDEAVNESYGTGEFYTFKFNSTTIPVKANPATAYNIKPIRTAPLAPLSCPFRIDYDFTWIQDTTKVEN